MTSQAKIVLNAEDRTAAAFASIGRNVDKLGFNLGTLKGAAVGALGALAVPISAAAVVGLAIEAAKAVDELKDLAEATGSSVESISALDKIARSTGANIDTVGTSLVKFNAVLKDADPDKGAGAVLKALNLDIAELKRLDPAEALLKTAKAMEQYADNGDKARAYQELFGKSIREMGPWMKDLAEQQKLQATVTAKQSEEVEKFNKALSGLQSEAADAARALSIDVLTSLNQVIDVMRGGNGAADEFTKWLVVPMQTAAVVGSNVALVLRGIGTEIGGIAAQAAAVARLDFSGVAEIGKMMTADAAAARRKQDDFDRRMLSIGSSTSSSDQSAAELARLTRSTPPKRSLSLPPESKPARGGRAGGGSSAAAKDPYAEANRYLDSIRKQIDGTQKLSEVEQALRELQLGRLGKVTPEIEKKILADAKSLDTLRELAAIDKVLADNDEKAIARAREKEDAIQALLDATPIKQLEEQRQVMLDLVEAYEAEKFGITGSAEALALLGEAQQTYLGTAGKAITELDKFTQQAASNIQDYLGSSFQQIMEGHFDNIGDAFVGMLNNMVAQAAAAQLSTHLFGKDGKGGGVASDFLSSIAKDLFVFGGARAEGGPVQRGKGYIVGERGPEWFEPSTNGVVVPNHALGARSPGQTLIVNNYFNVPASVDRRTREQVAADAGAGIQRAMRRLS